MKKLLKSVVCGTYEQCTGALFMGEKSKSFSLEKKKKSETQTCAWEAQNVLPKRTLNPCDFTVYALKKKKKKTENTNVKGKRVSKPGYKIEIFF